MNSLTFTSTDTATSFGNYQGSYSGTGGGGPGTFNHTATSATDVKGPLHTAGAGDVMSWSITPNGEGASAGDKIYVSDFYKTSVGVVYAGFHLIGINSLSSWIGAKASDIVYVTPEASTWAAIFGLVGVVGWQGGSRRRPVAVERELSRNSNWNPPHAMRRPCGGGAGVIVAISDLGIRGAARSAGAWASRTRTVA